jgi:hypothetical protein
MASRSGLLALGAVGRFVFRLGLLAAVGVAVVAAYVAVIEPWHTTWGATSDEIRARWPGDDQATDTTYVTTRAVTIDAAPEAVWPWLVQVGQGRGGLYSYEVLENLVGCDLHNASRIHPEWQKLQVGDVVRPVPERWMGLASTPKWTVTEVEPNAALVLSGFAAFVLEPSGPRSTRLVVHGRARSALAAQEPFSFVMIRRMMLGIKERAEGTRPPAILDVFEAVVWLALFVTSIIAAVWVLLRADWRPAFGLLVTSVAAFLLVLFARPPLGLAVLVTVITVLLLEIVRRTEEKASV